MYVLFHVYGRWLWALCCSVIKSCLTLCNPTDCSTPGFPVHHQLLELTQTHGHWVGDAIQPSYPLSSPLPPAFNLSQHQGLFQWVNTSHEVAKVLSFSFSIIPSKEIPGLMPFRMDGLDLLAVQGTLKSLLQHHNSKASLFWCSAFFIVQLSYLCSFQFSHSVMSDSLRPHELQHARPHCPSPTPGVHSNSCASSWWCYPAISFSVISFSSCPNPSQHQCLFQWVNSSYEVAKILEFQPQHQSFQWTPRTDLF